MIATLGAASGVGTLTGCLSGDGSTIGTATPESTDDGTTTVTEGTPDAGEFQLLEATVQEIHRAMESGEISATELTEQYLARIEAYDSELRSFITVNDAAVSRAESLDQTLAESGPVGPLHGIPIALKDNNDTADMPTTSGSETMEGVVPPDDAEIVERLREAGAIVVGKTNMHEFAAGIETYSSLGGQTVSPYGYAPGGSSGGSAAALAANLAAISTGTDTCGSVRIPPANNNAVGIRGTMGLVSRDGIAPMSVSQDIAGPMTRTVTDAAIMLDVMAGYDPDDPATGTAIGNIPAGDDPPITTAIDDTDDGVPSYTDFFNEDGLDGARIGLVRDFLDEENGASVITVVETAVEDMESAGAEIVDPVSAPEADGVILSEFRREFNNYLSSFDDPDAPENLSEIGDQPDNIHPEVEATVEAFLSVEVENLDENVDYLQAIAARNELAVVDEEGPVLGNKRQVLATMAEHDLDAMLYPTLSEPPVDIPEAEGEYPDQEGSNCNLSAATGLPAITFPGGFTDDGRPVGLELIGRPWTEGRLIELAYAYEQRTEHRTAPEGFGSLE
jgi:Asp-tRNA(Asn)/Glu-tRNA(Gln) amidotransferase A subunit family amidase